VLGVAGLGMKGQGESVGTGRAVKPWRPALTRGIWAPRWVAFSPECIQGLAAPGDAASGHGQAASLSYTITGGKGE